MYDRVGTSSGPARGEPLSTLKKKAHPKTIPKFLAVMGMGLLMGLNKASWGDVTATDYLIDDDDGNKKIYVPFYTNILSYSCCSGMTKARFTAPNGENFCINKDDFQPAVNVTRDGQTFACAGLPGALLADLVDIPSTNPFTWASGNATCSSIIRSENNGTKFVSATMRPFAPCCGGAVKMRCGSGQDEHNICKNKADFLPDAVVGSKTCSESADLLAYVGSPKATWNDVNCKELEMARPWNDSAFSVSENATLLKWLAKAGPTCCGAQEKTRGACPTGAEATAGYAPKLVAVTLSVQMTVGGLFKSVGLVESVIRPLFGAIGTPGGPCIFLPGCSINICSRQDQVLLSLLPLSCSCYTVGNLLGQEQLLLTSERTICTTSYTRTSTWVVCGRPDLEKLVQHEFRFSR